jgi:hypothetical protein
MKIKIGHVFGERRGGLAAKRTCTFLERRSLSTQHCGKALLADFLHLA